MRTHIRDLPVEITRPESAKFHHPLLFVHGLWTGGWIWERLITYLAHRGWESWAPSFLDARSPLDAPHARVAALEDVAVALPAAPVLVTHDIGLLTAAPLIERESVRSVVAIAPVVAPADGGGGRGLFAWPRFWRVLLGATRVPPPSGSAAAAFLGAALGVRDRLRTESGAMFRAVASGRMRVPRRAPVPGLVLGGAGDPIVTPATVAAVANGLGWSSRVATEGGHFLILERGFEAIADDVHRWTVQTLGADLLALLDEDDAADPL
jgi:predicted alpha/beta hydrolase family esterase